MWSFVGAKMVSREFRGLWPRHEGKMITGSFVRHTANPDRDSDVNYNKRTKSMGQVWGLVTTGSNGNSLRCPPSQDGINTLSSSCGSLCSLSLPSYGRLSRRVTLGKLLAAAPALSGRRMPGPSWCPRTQLCTHSRRHLILWAKGGRCQLGPDSSGSDKGMSLAPSLGSTSSWVMGKRKQGDISGTRVTFPLFQASGPCASSEAISATRKWVTTKEERYDQPSSSTRRFWPLLPYTSGPLP